MPTSEDIARHSEVHETLTSIKKKLEELQRELSACPVVSAEDECSDDPHDTLGDAIGQIDERLTAIGSFLATHDKE